MTQSIAISTPTTALSTQDFNYLRARGLEYIQQLGSALWTDHNLHDPGITILEVLCYALSDLGFRLNFSVKDLLTEADETVVSEAFHTAAQILSSEALTLNDYRKLLIDLKGVQNAWLFTAGPTGLPLIDPLAPKIYAWCKESKLLYESQLNQIVNPTERAHVQNEERVYINGLYSVKVELDEHPVYGDLNSTEVEYLVKTAPLAGRTLEVEFPKYIPSANDDFYTNVPYTVAIAFVNDTNLPLATFENLNRAEWKVNMTVTYATKNLTFNAVQIKCVKNDAGSKLSIKGTELKALLIASLAKDLINKYKVRPQQIIAKVKEVRALLHQNRNVCEDFLWDISLVDTEGLVLCADIDAEPNVDLEDVQAQIFVAIENYLLPPVRFFSLGELLEEGRPSDEIFEGPILQNGFIKEEMLEASELKQEYYLSDIISLIMDIPGVINIKNFSLRITDANGNTKQSGQLWKIPVTANHKLLLNKRKTKFLFFKNSLPLLAKYTETLNKMKLYASLKNQRKNEADTNDLPIPTGKYRNLDKHYTILDEFPALYGVGRKKLPEPLTVARKAQVRQLEGYLLFFDQLLANYFKQLYKVKDILSWKATEKATLYANYHFLDAQGQHNETAQTLLVDPENLKNGDLQKLVQSPNQFLDHKNRILDHLISRFAESFNEYALHMYALPDEAVLSDEQAATALIDQKINFLKNYPSISSIRSKAFDYTKADADVWNSTNVSGFEKRIRGLLGMTYGHRKKLQALPEGDLEGGFHIFEHLLLRPTKDTDQFLSICIEPDCHHCMEQDPYSFRISVVFPYWIKKFKNGNFRNYIERTLRREAPAHVLLKICWVNQTHMTALETAYEAWLAQKVLYTKEIPNITNTTQVNYTKALNDLINAIEALRTEFEETTLHNCEDQGEENDNRVRLGHTNLGKFKPQEDE